MRVVGKVENAIHWINHYSVDSVVCFVNTYAVDSVIQTLNNWGLLIKPLDAVAVAVVVFLNSLYINASSAVVNIFLDLC